MTSKLYLDSYQQLQKLSNKSFLLLAHCEHLARQDNRLKGDFFRWSDVFDKKVDSDLPSVKVVRSLLLPFIHDLGDGIADLFPECGYRCSVIVYFVPGTWKPLPVYVYADPKSGQQSPANNKWEKNIELKAEDISARLRHKGMPTLNEQQSHVFFLAHQYVSVVRQACAEKARDKDMKISFFQDIISKIIGNYGLSLWINLNKPANTKYQLPISCNEKSLYNLIWKSGDDVPLKNNFLLISPIFLNDDTLVLMASYFDHNKLSAAIKSLGDIRPFMGVHESLAQQVFSPLYTAMLRGDMARLRNNLSRDKISSALLDCAAKYLGKSEAKDLDKALEFTYAWKGDDDKERYCSDFKWSIYGDIINNPDSVFKLVLSLEKQVYEILQKDPIWKSIPYNTHAMALPKKMPLSSLLRTIEELARDLGTKDRDHILHQFHVFVFGSLMIRAEASTFLRAFAQSLNSKCRIGIKTDKSVKSYPESNERLALFLKSAWFLVSTCHDVGRPVQMVDDIVEALWEKVGELVHLDSSAIGGFPKFKVDNILYDDPRTYLLLRGLATAMAKWLDPPGKNIEDWWYFFRYMAFEKKNHAFTSALSLGLALTESLQRQDFALLFEEDNYGLFIASQILIPIILHHSYDWIDDLNELEKKAKKAPKKKKEIRAAVRIIKEILSSKKPYVHLEEFPLAVLLAVTDYLQEDGRPSGSKKKHWPDVLPPDVEIWEKAGHLNLSYKTTLKYPEPPAGADEKMVEGFESEQEDDIDKKQERAKRVEAIFDVKALRNVSLASIGLEYDGNRISIFEHKGDSFNDK